MRDKTKELVQRIVDLSDGVRTAQEISDAVGKSKNYVQVIIHNMGLPKVKMPKGFLLNPKQRSQENQEIVRQITALADGTICSREISYITGASQKYVQRIMKTLDLPRLPQGGPRGQANGSFSHGRHIDLDGYALVTAPDGHPGARSSGKKNVSRMYEHRLVMEDKIGRHLEKQEVVDHIDGLHLNNHPDNLRLFASNKDHLQATISGKVPVWSEEGYQKMCLNHDQKRGLPRVDSYYARRVHGDVRLQQILRAWLQLGTESPFLLGTHRWLEQAGIVDLSRCSLQLHLRTVSQRLEQILDW